MHDNQIQKLCLTGHSGFSHKGSDIVCAAVSGQVALVELGLLTYAGHNAGIKKEEGLFVTEPTIGEEVQVLLYSFYLGLLALEKEYPDYIQVKTKMI